MGMRNYLIEGLSGTTKAIRKPADRRMTPHEHHIWHVDKVKPWSPARMSR